MGGKPRRFVTYRTRGVCRGSPAQDEPRSLIGRAFGQWSLPPARCREKEKEPVPDRPSCLHPFRPRVPTRVPTRRPTRRPPAPYRRRRRDAHARRIRADRGRGPVHRRGARVRRTRGRREGVHLFPVSSCGLPPTQFPGTNPEFHCASGLGRMQGMLPRPQGDEGKKRHRRGLRNSWSDLPKLTFSAESPQIEALSRCRMRVKAPVSIASVPVVR